MGRSGSFYGSARYQQAHFRTAKDFQSALPGRAPPVATGSAASAAHVKASTRRPVLLPDDGLGPTHTSPVERRISLQRASGQARKQQLSEGGRPSAVDVRAGWFWSLVGSLAYPARLSRQLYLRVSENFAAAQAPFGCRSPKRLIFCCVPIRAWDLLRLRIWYLESGHIMEYEYPCSRRHFQRASRWLTRAVALSAVVAGCIGLATSSARAGTIDPLHGFCNGTMPAGACADNGHNTPLGSNSTDFGFSISPGPQTGDFLLVILVPNNYVIPLTFAVTGTQGGPTNTLAIAATASLFSATAWTSGDLDMYFGISASPNNPIGAYLPTTAVLDPGATGFFAFVADLGQNRIWDNSNELNGPIFNSIAGLGSDLGAYIVGFCGPGQPASCDGTRKHPFIATANSGALLVNGSQPVPEIPEPGSLGLLAVALTGLVLSARRRMHRS